MDSRIIRIVLIVFLTLPAAGLSAETSTYTIQEGETLFGIAKKIQVPVEVLCAYNAIGDPSRVKAGAVVRLPRAYSVRKGDTLFSIARSFSVPLDELLALNKMRESSRIKPGTKLFIPGPNRQGAAASEQVKGGEDPGQTRASSRAAAQDGAPAVADDANERIVWPHPGKREPFSGKISGLVFHGNRGDRVVSASGGEVKWVGPYWGWGKTIIVRDDGGLLFIYAGNEDLMVNVGDRVKPGTEIARLGASPQDGAARLYFSIQQKNGQALNPEKYVSRG